MPLLEECHVLVLAAGMGSRMGLPKALMQVGGRAWWRSQHERLAGNGLSSTWIVSEHVERALANERVIDRMLRGAPGPMFASLLIGLRSVEVLQPVPRLVFVLPVDTPVPTLSVWRALAEEGATGVCVPEHLGKRGHPVCMPWGWVKAHVLGLPNPDNVRLDELMAGAAGGPEKIRSVRVADARVAVNLNTPDDVLRYERSMQRP